MLFAYSYVQTRTSWPYEPTKHAHLLMKLGLFGKVKTGTNISSGRDKSHLVLTYFSGVNQRGLCNPTSRAGCLDAQQQWSLKLW